VTVLVLSSFSYYHCISCGIHKLSRKPTMSETTKHSSPRNSKGSADIWQNSTMQATPLSTHQMAAKVYIEKLILTAEQRSQILELYAQDAIEDFTYFPNNGQEQIASTALLAAHHLDFDARECLASQWSIKWGVNSGKKVLLQTGECCISGE
jgi:hypothetical protein